MKRKTRRNTRKQKRCRTRQSGRGYKEIVTRRKNLIPVVKKAANAAKELEDAIQKALK